MPQFELRRPGSLPEALDLLAAGGTPYCGGTELLPVMQLGLTRPQTLVDLKRTPELAGIDRSGEEIRFGARVTHAEASSSPLARRHVPVLAAAAAQLGNARVRAAGTLAGNICFAEPRSDVLTALIALRARVDLRSAQGARSELIEEFVEGGFVTSREESELAVTIRAPVQGPGAYVRFQPAEYPTVTVAVTSDSDGCRVVVGAVGDRPEAFVFSGVGDVDADAIAERVDVTEDLNGSEDYKRHLTSVFVARALARLPEPTSSA